MTLLYTANQHANKRNDQLVTPKKTAQPGEKYYKRTLHIHLFLLKGSKTRRTDLPSGGNLSLKESCYAYRGPDSQ